MHAAVDDGRDAILGAGVDAPPAGYALPREPRVRAERDRAYGAVLLTDPALGAGGGIHFLPAHLEPRARGKPREPGRQVEPRRHHTIGRRLHRLAVNEHL